MAYPMCEDCGSKIYGNHCVSCHEEIFIADQYREEGIPIPKGILLKEAEQVANPSIPESY
jgi:hypothetical protein